MFTINNKILFILISLSLGLIVLGVIGIATKNQNFDTPFNIGIDAFILCGTYMLAMNGEFIKSDEYRFTRLGIAIFIMGLLMRLMHWSHAKEIMAIGYLIIPLIYLVHMLKHKRTRWTNFFKLFLTFLIVFSKSVLLLHMEFSDELVGIAVLLVLILLIDAVVNKKISMDE